jgi:hypothetical protein
MFNCPFNFPQAFEVLKRLIQNLFEIATSIMNVDSKWPSTFEIYIPHSEEVFFLVSYWLVFTFLVSYWLEFTFFLTIADSK